MTPIMSIVIRTIIMYLLLDFGGHLSSAVTTGKTLFTLHPETAWWNTANNVCKANFGRLAKIDDANTREVVQHYMNNWPSIQSYNWIGLHYNEMESNYGWTGLCEKLDTNRYSNWATSEGEPDYDYEKCVSVRRDSVKWFNQGCWEEHSFLCENRKGECVFKTENKTSLNKSADLSSVIIPAMTPDECKQRCRELLTQDGKECWAVTFNSGTADVGNDERCTIYYTTNQFIPSDARLWTCNADIDLYIKICYEGALDNASIPSSLVDYNTVPVKSCYDYADSLGDVTPAIMDEQSSAGQPLTCIEKLASSTPVPDDPTPSMVQPMSASPSMGQSITEATTNAKETASLTPGATGDVTPAIVDEQSSAGQPLTCIEKLAPSTPVPDDPTPSMVQPMSASPSMGQSITEATTNAKETASLTPGATAAADRKGVKKRGPKFTFRIYRTGAILRSDRILLQKTTASRLECARECINTHCYSFSYTDEISPSMCRLSSDREPESPFSHGENVFSLMP